MSRTNYCQDCRVEISAPPARWCLSCAEIRRSRGEYKASPNGERQEQVLAYIASCEGNVCPPTVREIGMACQMGFSSVAWHLRVLVAEGRIRMEHDKVRTIRLSAVEKERRRLERYRVASVREAHSLREVTPFPDQVTHILTDEQQNRVIFVYDGDPNWG